MTIAKPIIDSVPPKGTGAGGTGAGAASAGAASGATVTSTDFAPHWRAFAGAADDADQRFADAARFPWRHGFLPLLRHTAAKYPHHPLIGRAQRPQQEPFRLGQQASLTFAPREIAEVTQRNGRPTIKLFGLGMLGPNGPLPIHMTETVRERSEAKRDSTLANFLDVFHHRSLTHLYRAWSQAQAAAGLDRADHETFSPYIARIAGDDPDEVAQTPLPRHARWASSAHRVRQARNPDGLVATLSNYFGIGVVLHEYQMHWITIEPNDTCCIGTPRTSSILGQGALAGEVVPDRQHKFRLVLGPLSLNEYLRFTPQGTPEGRDLPALVEWVRAFVGYEFVWEVELVLRREEAPPSRLGGDARLGWSSWMGSAISGDTVTGMVYEPENYVRDDNWKGRAA